MGSGVSRGSDASSPTPGMTSGGGGAVRGGGDQPQPDNDGDNEQENTKNDVENWIHHPSVTDGRRRHLDRLRRTLIAVDFGRSQPAGRPSASKVPAYGALRITQAATDASAG